LYPNNLALLMLEMLVPTNDYFFSFLGFVHCVEGWERLMVLFL